MWELKAKGAKALAQGYTVSWTVAYILQRRKLKHREAKQLFYITLQVVELVFKSKNFF